jgi:hypothetical protein
LLKFVHEQDLSPAISAHSSKSDGAPYCALGVYLLDDGQLMGVHCDPHHSIHGRAYGMSDDSLMVERSLTSSEEFG